MIRIVLVDDHPIVREGLRAVLETQTDFEVVGEAANGREAITLTMRLRPNIVLLDLEMPIVDGVEAVQTINKLAGPVHTIVFTAFDNDERILRAVQAGANGYLLKGVPRDEIFNAIRITMQGGSLLQPVIASRLLQYMRPSSEMDESKQKARYVEPLTERELEVLNLLAQGMPNKEIAVHLVISERTAKFHVSAIMSKLGATNRTEAVSLAAQNGLINLRA